MYAADGHSKGFFLFHLYFIFEWLSLVESLDIIESCQCDVLQCLSRKEGLMGRDDDIGHHEQQSQVVVVEHAVGVVLIKELRLFLIDIESCRPHLVLP